MGSHFRTPDGELVDGMAAARVASAVPSPTTILSSWVGWALQQYKERQLVEAAMLDPFLPPRDLDGEALVDYQTSWMERIREGAGEHAKRARDFGTNFHEWAAAFHHSHPTKIDCLKDCKVGSLKYMEWFDENVRRVVMVEQVVFGLGYAGQLDVCVELKDSRVVLLDPKTQGLKGRKKFNHYNSWAWQLGAYANALEETMSIKVDALISPCIASDSDLVEFYEWPEKPAVYAGVFQGLQAAWEQENRFYATKGIFKLPPRGKTKLAAPATKPMGTYTS